MQKFDPKTPWERRFYTMDFTKDLPAGVTITALTIDIEVISGTDPAATSMIDGSPEIAGAVCGTWIIDGIDGVDYALGFRGTCSDGSKLEEQGRLPVRTQL